MLQTFIMGWYYWTLQIRHRGSFMKTFSILTLLFITIMCLLIMTLAKIIPNDDSCISISESIVGNSITNFLVKFYTIIGENTNGQEGIFLLLFIWGLLLIQLGGDGCATFDDMQHDVLQALSWLKSNEDLIGLKCSSFKSGEQQSGGNKSTSSNSHQKRWLNSPRRCLVVIN